MFAIGWIVALSLPAFSQTPVDAKAGDAPATQITTLTTNVRRVALDVVVTDWDGHSLPGLVADDFKVEEDKAPQTVRSFDVHTSANESAYLAPNLPSLPPGTFLNVSQSPEVGTPTVILYDALHTGLDDQEYARQELLKFLRRRRPGTQIAIFVLGSRLRLIQGFTQDTGLLIAALASTKGRPRAVALHASKIAPNPVPGAMEGDLAYDKALYDAARLANMSLATPAVRPWDLTLSALAEIGRFLSGVPGRKNLVWMTSSFDSGIFGREDPAQTGWFDRRTMMAYRQAMDLLNLSHTAVYPVDAKGIRAIVGNPKFGIQENRDRLTMDMVAAKTGGHAYYGTNDLAEAVGRAIVNGSTYYSLTYEPTNPKYDGSLRHIKVTLTKPGYNLSYRRTYYADDLNAVARSVADAPESPLTPALERGIPLSQGLIVEAHLEVAGPPVAATPEQMQVLSQYEAMRTRGKRAAAVPVAPVMMQSYLISYGLLAQQLDLSVDDAGARRAMLEFGMIAYDDDGRKLNGVDTHIEDAIPAERYAKVASDGYHVGQSVAVPVGAASLRLAVRDARSGRVGSLEVRLPLAGGGTTRLGATK